MNEKFLPGDDELSPAFRWRTALVAVSFAATLFAASPASAQAQQTFGDWTAGCDNVRGCRAVGLPAGPFGYGRIVFDRSGEATAPARFRIVLDFDSKAKQLPVHLSFDETGFERLFPGEIVATGVEGRFELALPASAVADFVAALRKASVLTVRQAQKPSDPQQAETRISLKGSVAALRWIDDQQKRAGGVTAMVARGSAPASAVPRAPPIPVLPKPGFKAQALSGEMPPAVFEAWKEACDEWDDAIKRSKPKGYRISPDAAVWEAPCSSGAYNFSSNFFLFAGGKASLLKFLQWSDGKTPAEAGFRRNAEELVNAEFVESDSSIQFFSKGRGISDCGASGSYAWDGAQFRLQRYDMMGECRGALAEDWLTLWRSAP